MQLTPVAIVGIGATKPVRRSEKGIRVLCVVDRLPTTYSQKLRKGEIFGDADPREDPRAMDMRAIKQSRGRDRTAPASS